MAARVSSTSATAATAGGSTLASRNTEAAAVASSIMGDGKSWQAKLFRLKLFWASDFFLSLILNHTVEFKLTIKGWDPESSLAFLPLPPYGKKSTGLALTASSINNP